MVVCDIQPLCIHTSTDSIVVELRIEIREKKFGSVDERVPGKVVLLSSVFDLIDLCLSMCV